MTSDQQRRLANIMGWVRSAKETLPAINEGPVGPGRVAQMSALLDRLHGSALALQDQAAPPAPRRHRAA